MHLNYYLLKRLSKQLNQNLQGAQVIEVFSQEKNELIIGLLLTNNDSFYIRATLQNEFTALSFPDNFARSRKNSADLFPTIIGNKVSHIHQYENERAFHVAFRNETMLLFKMHGNRSNIIYFDKKQGAHLFKQKLVPDKLIEPKLLERPITLSIGLYLNANGYTDLYPTFGKHVKSYLEAKSFERLEKTEQWYFLQDLVNGMESNTICVINENGKPVLSLVESNNTSNKCFETPIDALNYFYRAFHSEYTFDKEKSKLLNQINKKITQGVNYISKSEGQLKKLENSTPPNQIADILMANLHSIAPNLEKVTLLNFYNDEMVEVKLNKLLSPQRNAENYYRKSKNRKIEVEKLYENTLEKEELLSKLRLLASEIEEIHSLKSLRAFAKENGLDDSKKTQEVVLPYKMFSDQGFKIWVGKNAKSNDELTLKHSFKEDLWLHAKDVPGSHVLVKHQAGKTFPISVIERAAGYAAYYSKRKTDTLVPVIYTPAKYVRKKKGTAAGQVYVAQEKVIMVPALGPQTDS